MNSKILFSALLSLCSLSLLASPYHLNESQISMAFEESEDITDQLAVMAFYDSQNELTISGNDDSMDKQTIAAIVAFAEWITGIGILIPIHRIVLGCSGEELKVIVLYCVTLGGCGLLPLIDGIMLLVDDSKSRYIENPKYLMWLQ